MELLPGPTKLSTSLRLAMMRLLVSGMTCATLRIHLFLLIAGGCPTLLPSTIFVNALGYSFVSSLMLYNSPSAEACVTYMGILEHDYLLCGFHRWFSRADCAIAMATLIDGLWGDLTVITWIIKTQLLISFHCTLEQASEATPRG